MLVLAYAPPIIFSRKPATMHSIIPKDRYAIIIGAMKCGTSSLYVYLANHPGICPATVKEPEFFSEHQAHRVDVADYNSLWAFEPSKHRYALEASTGYTKYPTERHVPERMRRYGIAPKLIYIVRNPFDRIVSHFNALGVDRSCPSPIRAAQLIDTSNYFLQLEQFRRHFPIEDLLLLDFDELRDQPAKLMRRTYDFLGLPAHYTERYEILNDSSTSRLELRVAHSRASSTARRIPRRVKSLARRVARIVSSPPEKRVLTQAERDVIHRRLADDMTRLYDVYGFDVRKWGFALDRATASHVPAPG
jgi:hypothetical protein